MHTQNRYVFWKGEKSEQPQQKLPGTWGEAAEADEKAYFYEHFCPKNLGVATKIAQPLENTGNKQESLLLRTLQNALRLLLQSLLGGFIPIAT